MFRSFSPRLTMILLAVALFVHPVWADPGAIVQKAALNQAPSPGVPVNAIKPPPVGAKTVKLSVTESLAAGTLPNASSLAGPYLSRVQIRHQANLEDPDGDGYYAFFSFDIGIGVRTTGQSQQVMATIYCDYTAQEWVTNAWTIAAATETTVDVPFDRSDFVGPNGKSLFAGNTDLNFVVTLYDVTGQTQYGSKTTSSPFRADPILVPYISYAAIQQWNSKADEDQDGYASHFSFRIACALNTDRDDIYTVNVWVTCETTGDAWVFPLVEVPVQGLVSPTLSEKDFLGSLSGNVKLDFTVKAVVMGVVYNWDGSIKKNPDGSPVWTELYTSDTEKRVAGEPLLVDPIPTQIAEAKIYKAKNLVDGDRDKYYSNYDFTLSFRPEIPSGTKSLSARILCTTTGQTWILDPWTATAGADVFVDVSPAFNEGFFVGYLHGNTDLYFRLDLYDGTGKTLLHSTSNIANQPFLADPVPAPDEASALVRHFYNTILGREPEPGAVDAWINGYFMYALYQDVDVRFIGREMGRYFFTSQEYANRQRDREGYIRDCYQAFLWRDPSPMEVAAWLDGLWDRAPVLAIFTESAEFNDLIAGQWFPGYEGTPSRNFVTTMYIGFLDRLSDPAGLDWWSETLEQAADRRQATKDMALTILRSDEYRDRKESAAGTVTHLYRGFLGRFPADGERDAWAGEISSGRQKVEQVVEFFGNAPEFTRRLNQYFP